MYTLSKEVGKYIPENPVVGGSCVTMIIIIINDTVIELINQSNYTCLWIFL